MKRSERLQTSVTPDEKTDFRVEAAKRDMDMSQLLRKLVYDHLEETGHETSRGDSGNRTRVARAD